MSQIYYFQLKYGRISKRQPQINYIIDRFMRLTQLKWYLRLPHPLFSSLTLCEIRGNYGHTCFGGHISQCFVHLS